MATTNTETEDTSGNLRVDLDPEKKSHFKAYCALKKTTMKDCLTYFVDQCIDKMIKGED